MEILPITFMTVCIPTGMIFLVESINAIEKKQDLYWAGLCFLALGALAMFWGIWQVYLRREEEIKKNYEEGLLRIKQIQLLEAMLSELKKLRKNTGE